MFVLRLVSSLELETRYSRRSEIMEKALTRIGASTG